MPLFFFQYLEVQTAKKTINLFIVLLGFLMSGLKVLFRAMLSMTLRQLKSLIPNAHRLPQRADGVLLIWRTEKDTKPFIWVTTKLISTLFRKNPRQFVFIKHFTSFWKFQLYFKPSKQTSYNFFTHFQKIPMLSRKYHEYSLGPGTLFYFCSRKVSVLIELNIAFDSALKCGK